MTSLRFLVGGLILAVTLVAAAMAQAPARTIWSGVYTAPQAARGAALYATHCALCHGPTLLGADGPPLTGVEFAGNWNGLTLDVLADRIRTAMPPGDPSVLGAQDRADVIAYVLQAGKFPAGDAELPRDAATLAGIQFQAVKP